MTAPKRQRINLDELSFSSLEGFNGQLIEWRYDRLSRFFHGRTCLELGSSDGRGTERLLTHFEHVVAVEGNERAASVLRERLPEPRLAVVHSRFEDLALEEQFDTVLLAHVLEHVDDPHQLLLRAKRLLHPDGVIIADVPNAMSLHRQVGVKMGLLDKVTDLNDADRSIGHQRVYTPATFDSEIRRAGLDIDQAGGIFLKVLSNDQTERLFDQRQLAALLEVGSDNPEIASEIYVVARARTESRRPGSAR